MSPIWPLECPKKDQEIAVSYWLCVSSEFLMKNYLHMQICSFYGLLLARLAICDPFGPPIWLPGCPKKGVNCPKWGKSIKSLVRIYLYEQICSFWGITFKGMGNFWPFLTPRVPQKESKLVVCPKLVTV